MTAAVLERPRTRQSRIAALCAHLWHHGPGRDDADGPQPDWRSMLQDPFARHQRAEIEAQAAALVDMPDAAKREVVRLMMGWAE